MSTTKAISKPTSEPVSLALFKSHLRLSPDETSEDVLLEHYISAARAKAEKYCNQYFTDRTLETTFEVTEPFELPDGAGPVQSVRGYITSVEELPSIGQRWSEYVKGISVNRDYSIAWDNLPTYTVTYDIQADPEPDVLTAILKIAADLYENRENSTTGVTNKALAISYQLLLNPYRIVNG